MKKIRTFALVNLAFLATAVGLSAQTQALKANIPFNFIVGDTSLPAGIYTISSPDWHVMEIRNPDRHVELVLGSQSAHEATKGSELVFNRVGGAYFLHRILSPEVSSLNKDIPTGKVEKRMRKQEAMLSTEDETLVAAQ